MKKKQYEYERYVVSSGGERSPDSVLKQKGLEGWELVAVLSSGGFSGSQEVYYFKRELTNLL